MTETSSATCCTRDRLSVRLAVGGAVVSALGLAFAPLRIWSNLFLAAFYLLSLALGGALFTALARVTGAGWHTAFRRIPEALVRIVPTAGLLMLAVLACRVSHYGWHAHGGGDPGTFAFKQFWLTPSFWLARTVGYLILWSVAARWLIARSRNQDRTGDPHTIGGDTALSALFLGLYAVTFSLAGVDWLMALEPLWFSTMWGVYQFAGMFQATLAVVVLLGLKLRSDRGPLAGKFTDEHLHDLGKLLVGLSCFWMYIWFCQYMLIWYSNIPEETSYFITRTHGPWGPVTAISVLLNWIVPFFMLLPRPAKRSGRIMARAAAIILVGRWIDLYVMIFPSVLGEKPVFGIWETAAACCLIGTTSLLVRRSFAAAAPVPSRDPYLAESLHYHA